MAERMEPNVAGDLWGLLLAWPRVPELMAQHRPRFPARGLG